MIVVGVFGFAAAGTASHQNGEKVFVCKYVGTPGVDERLQTGNNPISVSVNAIPVHPVVIGSEFADAHGRSIVIAFDVGQPEPDVSACPGGDTPPPFDACPNILGNQPEGTECGTPPPPFDACPNIPGNQPEGTECGTPPPPFDACPNIPGNQPRGTVCESPPPPSGCPDGLPANAGKDGEEGNDDCKRTPPVVETIPEVIIPVVTPPVVTPPVIQPPKPKPPVFKPPVVKPAKPKAPAVCVQLGISTHMVKADGKRDRLVVKVGSREGAKVWIRGAGVSQSARTNAQGIAVFTFNAQRIGIITIKAQGACNNARVGVVDVKAATLSLTGSLTG